MNFDYTGNTRKSKNEIINVPNFKRHFLSRKSYTIPSIKNRHRVRKEYANTSCRSKPTENGLELAFRPSNGYGKHITMRTFGGNPEYIEEQSK